MAPVVGGAVAPMLGAGVGGVVVEVGAGVLDVQVGVGVGVGMPELGADVVGVGSGEPITAPGDDGIDVGAVGECMDPPPVCDVREEPELSALFAWLFRGG